MSWSKLKKAVEQFFAESVKGRVALRMTQYKTCEFRCGRGWITIDGREILDASTHRAMDAFGREVRRLMGKDAHKPMNADRRFPVYADQLKSLHMLDDTDFTAGPGEIGKVRTSVRNDLIERGFFTEADFLQALSRYPEMPIKDILACRNPIVRAIAMLDRRVGKRRLKAIDLKKEHLLARRLLEFRLEAEGMATPAKPAAET